MMYQVLNNLGPSYLSNLLIRSQTLHNHNTRNATNFGLALPLSRTKMGKLAFSHEGAALWNQLPFCVRQAQSKHSFTNLYWRTLRLWLFLFHFLVLSVNIYLRVAPINVFHSHENLSFPMYVKVYSWCVYAYINIDLFDRLSINSYCISWTNIALLYIIGLYNNYKQNKQITLIYIKSCIRLLTLFVISCICNHFFVYRASQKNSIHTERVTLSK